MSRLFTATASVVLIAALTGCAAIPADVDGAYDRARDEGLRVGITSNPPWTDASGDEPRGIEVDLIEGFAEDIGADVEWTVGTEAVLVDELHEGRLDVAIGGFTDDTLWVDKVATTAAYREVRSERGVTEKHVMLTRAGENRLLVELEAFLRENGDGS